ncbi:MAG: hypothetical protein HY875_01110 [Chloroflexi bacterium]|nr:hypothetical protein [Chloroflexota bacterium]
MSLSSQSGTGGPFRGQAVLLLQEALVIFVFTVVVGILNGTDLVDFGRKTLLTHVHGGTLGWITLSVFAASLLLFGEGHRPGPAEVRAVRGLTALALVAIPAFVATFFLTFGEARPFFGSFALLAIAGFLAWMLVRARGMAMTAPHWGFLVAMGTSVAGGVVGVLLGYEIATGRNVLPSGGEDAHPGTMVVGFLIPVGMALSEWCFKWPRPDPARRLGTIQMVFPFLGGLVLLFSLLLDITPLAPVAALLELVGVGIFVWRMWPAFRRVDWLARGAAPFAAASAIATLANILLIQYLVGRYAGDFDKVPDHELLALDHTMFIGVMTNAIFGLVFSATNTANVRWPSLDRVVFWGTNLGLAVFSAGLLVDVTAMKRVATPVMGASILLGLALYSVRFAGERFGSRVPAMVPEGVSAGGGS